MGVQLGAIVTPDQAPLQPHVDQPDRTVAQAGYVADELQEFCLGRRQIELAIIPALTESRQPGRVM